MTRLVYFEGMVLLLGFSGVIAWKLCTGKMNLNYLLYGETPDRLQPSRFFSPGRAQLLVVTLLAAGYYLMQTIQDSTRFPEIPTSWIVALAGSQTIYLGGKARSAFNDFRSVINKQKHQ